MTKLSPLFAGASLTAVALAFPAVAQETDTGEENQGSIARVLQAVQVTATKGADVENVQSVPVTVTAFNDDTLDALKVRDLQGLTFSSPNVSLDDIGTSRGTANFSIRGLGVNSSIPSIDPTVGVFVDGVYLGLNNGVVFDLFDLDSIELLRGPQGLLFGRNTTGGAVLINTGNPTDELEYKARYSIDGPALDGRGGPNQTFQGTISGPLVDGVLNGKIGAYYNTDSGYFENLEDGSNHGEAQTQIYRGALEWFPTERLTVLAKGEYFDSRGDGPSAQNRGIYDRGSFDFAIDNDGELESEIIFGSIRADLDVDFGGGTITNILGYREIDQTTDADIDATNLFLFHSTTELAQEQISNELRYAGTFGKVGVTTGLYYFNQDVAYTEVRDLPPVSAATFYGGGEQDHTVYGVFAQMDYAFTEKFTGTFGLRYSYEEKDAGITYVRPRPVCSVVESTCPTSGTNPFVPGENNGFTDSNDWSNVTPKIGFQYFADNGTNFYGNYTKGFRSGGYNFRITSPAAFEAIFPDGSERSFDEEEVDSYELGMKYQTEDGRARLNAATFWTTISDMQRELNLSDPQAGVLQTIINTADATIVGLELEGTYAVTDTLLLTANLGLIDAEYDEVLFDISSNGSVGQDDLALALPRVPETTWGVGAIHDLDLGNNGLISSRINYQYRDAFAYTDNNFGFIQEVGMLDANFTWETPFDGFSVSLYGKNLLDEVQAGGDTQLPFGGPQAALAPGGENLANGVDTPFDNNPAVGTFSPLKKGRLLGIEFTYRR